MFIKKISFSCKIFAILANVDLNFWPGPGPPAPPPPPTPFPTPQARAKRAEPKPVSLFPIVLPIVLLIELPIDRSWFKMLLSPGPDRLGLKCYLAWGGGEVGGWGGAKGPGPDPFGFARAWGVGRGVGGGGGGAKGPGPDRLGFRPFRPGLGGGEGGGWGWGGRGSWAGPKV